MPLLALLLLALPARAALDPLVEKERAYMNARMFRWGQALFPESRFPTEASRPLWYRQLKAAVDEAESVAELDRVDECFEFEAVRRHERKAALDAPLQCPQAEDTPREELVEEQRAPEPQQAVPGRLTDARADRTLAFARANARWLAANPREAELAARSAVPAPGEVRTTERPRRARPIVAAIPAPSAAPSRGFLDGVVSAFARPAQPAPLDMEKARVRAAYASEPRFGGINLAEDVRGVPALEAYLRQTLFELQQASTLAAVKRVELKLRALAGLIMNKRRIIATYKGLEPYVRLLAPNAVAAYRQAMEVLPLAHDTGTVANLEEQLRGVGSEVTASARLIAGTGPDRLQRLQAHARADRVETEPPPFSALRLDAGVLRAERECGSWSCSGSADAWRSFIDDRLAVEAGLVLDTRFPVIVADRRDTRATVLRGEDYGVDDPAKLAAAQADKYAREAEDARLAVERARAAVTTAEAELERMKAEGLRLKRESEAAVLAERQAGEAAARAQREAEEAARLMTEAVEAATRRQAAAEEIINAVLRNEEGIDLDILFDTGRATLRQDEHTRRQLADLGRALAGGLRDLVIELGGHTDAAGEPRFDNLGLSQRRAETVRQHLLRAHKLPSDKLIAHGYGSSKLKNQANKLAGENRRVQVKARIDPEARKARLDAAELEVAEAQRLQTEADGRTAVFRRQSDAALEAERTRQDAAAAAERLRVSKREADEAAERVAAERRRLEAAVPAAQRAQALADEVAAGSRVQARRAQERAEGAFIVRDTRGHMSWFGGDPQLADRFAHSLREGFEGWAAQGGRTANAVFRLKDGGGRDLAQAVAAELVAMDPTRTNRDVVRGGWDDLMSMNQRWLTVSGRVARDGFFRVQDLAQLPAQRPERPRPIEVSIVQEPSVAVELHAQARVSGGPVVSDSPGESPTGAPGRGEPAGAVERRELPAPDAAALERARLNQEALDRATRLAAEAAQRADAARKRLGQLRADAERIGAAAAQYREALTRARATAVKALATFAHDSATIQSDAELLPLCEALKSEELRNSRFFIHGHTNRAGRESAEYNRALSVRRAQAVLAVFQRCGLLPSRFQVQGFGFDRPLPNEPPESAAHRRVLVGRL